MDFAQLRHALQQLAPLSNAAWAALPPLLATRRLQVGEMVLRAGDIATRVFFVRQGLLREFYIDQDGNTATRRFCQAGEFSGSLADLLTGSPAMTSIEALEASEVWHMAWQDFQALTRENTEWLLLARRLAETLYLRKSQREFEMLTQRAAQRYAAFRAEFPALEARLPRQLVASYLGITPVHLSRLRAGDTASPAAPGKPGKR